MGGNIKGQPAEISGVAPGVICDAGQRRRVAGARRQARYRQKQSAAGLVSVTVLVPSAAVPDLQQLAETIRDAPHLLPGPVRDPISGKLVSFRRGVRR
jgi:hypothetical protein